MLGELNHNGLLRSNGHHVNASKTTCNGHAFVNNIYVNGNGGGAAGQDVLALNGSKGVVTVNGGKVAPANNSTSIGLVSFAPGKCDKTDSVKEEFYAQQKNGRLPHSFPQIIMRNPKLFYEAAFIARPKPQHHHYHQQQQQEPHHHHFRQQNGGNSPRQAPPLTPPEHHVSHHQLLHPQHHHHQHTQKVIIPNTAYSPPSSTGTGCHSTTGSGVSTPDSLKGNLRRRGVDPSSSCHNNGTGQQQQQHTKKKHVKFDLVQRSSDEKKRGMKHGFITSNNGNDTSDEDDGDDSNDEAEEDDFDEIERSLMQGYSEYDVAGALRLTSGGNAHANHSSSSSPTGKRKPDLLRLEFGLSCKAGHAGIGMKARVCTRGEPIDAELPLDQQTWYFGAISRQEAEEILRICSEGCYIVRACELACRRDYSLAIKSSCGFMHLRIHRQSDDLYRLADFNRVFFTVPHLIEYYSLEQLPIRGAECTILLHPVHQQLL
ncbi:putative SH2 domain-containing adapter protein F [Hypsibius exemplaris]|uniref:SH2 domain-containing adapter protein F n=1 Tax=Hypsibius exemplaris TaxID=2072580 RepID=A0A9X6RMV1_HYPEX|nr:putative SH2 domain-containing adapter protein F [Hypsibius exemplaris]